MRRREFISLLGGAAAGWPLTARAQQSVRIPRIGVLMPASVSTTVAWIEALRSGLHELGYEEGKNIIFEFRWAEGKGDRLPGLVAELIRLNVDVLVTFGTPGARAAKEATTTIPIVMAASGDAVATGFIASLARPGGNITGQTIFNPELCAKRLELLKEALPRTNRVAILFNPDNPISWANLQAAKLTADSLSLELQQFEARGLVEIDSAFPAMANRPVDAIEVFEDAVLFAHDKRIAANALASRLPLIGYLDLADAGGLLAYGVNFTELFRRAAVFVDKILKGAKPSDLPVEQPTKFQLVINLKTAKALRIEVLPMLIARADRLIE
jgi:ABC-type uncharacterized transport system substrate-binding protein